MTSSAIGSPRLGIGARISYGVGSIAQGVGTVALSTAVINYYLVSVVGLRPALVGALVLVSLLIDAVLDPAIGRWSDTFRSPWGRRHPFMYASALPIALATCFLWRNPFDLSGVAMAAYVFAMLVVLRIAGGLYQIPSDALAPELAPDYHGRTNLLSWRWFFGVIGFLVVAILLNGVFLKPDKLHKLGQNNPAGYANFGVAAAVIVVVCILFSTLATQRYIPYLHKSPPRQQSLGQAVREMGRILANPSLIAVMASGLISGVASGISSSLQNFMSFDFWGVTPPQVALLTAAVAPASFIGVLAAPLLSRMMGKKRSMITVFTLSVFVGVVPVTLRLLGVLPPGVTPLVLTLLGADLFISSALGLSGFVIVGSMVADVVEDAAVKTGVRAEGLLFAANGLLPKVTGGLGALIGNLLLEVVHFPADAAAHPDAPVDPTIMHNLALISLPFGAVLNLASIAVLLFYRIDRGAHEANLEALRTAAAISEPPTALPIGGAAIPDPGTAASPSI